MKFSIAIYLVAVCLGALPAQEDLKIGEWRSHLPYQEVRSVTHSEEAVYYGTEESILIYDKDDNSIDFLTKVEGLSETGIQRLEYDEANQQLIVAYTNSVIDIVSGNDVFRIADIKDKIEIQGDKNIYDMHIQAGRFLYIATGFGLVQFDLQSLEFGFTLDISQQVFAVHGHGNQLVMALDQGAYHIDLTQTNAPGFLNEWTRFEIEQDSSYIATDVYMTSDKTYLSTTDKVYLTKDNTSFDLVYESNFEEFEILFIKESPQGWMLGMRNEVRSRGKSKLIFFNNEDQQVDLIDDCINNLIDAVIDSEGRLFYTDLWRGIKYQESSDGPCLRLEINSPNRSDASWIDVAHGKVFFATGGITENFKDLYSTGGINIYDLETKDWTNLDHKNFSFLDDNDILQVYKVAAHPSNDKVYLASFWAGLVEYDTETEEFQLFNETNTNGALTFQQGDKRVRLAGLDFDRDNNLWMSNYSAAKPIAVLSNEGFWYSFNISASDDKVEDIVIDDNGYAWVVIGGSSGSVVVYDKGENLADPTDDRQRFITSTELESNLVYSVAVDRTGSVWVGTGKGVVVYECGSAAIEADACEGNRRKVLQDSIVAFLLESEEVLSIAVDGADRKWFGTRNGIFVQSPDGEQQVAKLDQDNSPLFDNTIRAMAYEESSGIMYIASNAGVQSVRTETTGAKSSHSSQVYAFPNPVRADYLGPIAIKGLARDADVRITDLDGKLVYKTTALGGQAIWDGNDLNGNLATGGVYLVFSSSTELLSSINTYVTKILVIR